MWATLPLTFTVKMAPQAPQTPNPDFSWIFQIFQQSCPPARRVLLLGGGDGVMASMILKYAHVEHLTLVEIDAKVAWVTIAVISGINRLLMSLIGC